MLNDIKNTLSHMDSAEIIEDVLGAVCLAVIVAGLAFFGGVLV